MAQPEKDALTGTDTTGHEWDGIKELNTPLPKWWLYSFYACIVWAIGYWVLYPAWPGVNGFTKGVLGYSSRAELDDTMKMVANSRSGWLSKFEEASVGDIANDKELLTYAMAGGKFIFNENCSACHGSGGQGAPGYPVLADDDWIWGGTLEAIETTIRFGIRSEHGDARISDMPKFGKDELIPADQIKAVAAYVMSLSGNGQGDDAGKAVFMEQCAACHGEDGKGVKEVGGPNLADGIWLFEGSEAAVVKQVTNPTHGVMPSWQGRLDNASIKQVAVYVHSLGGGE